MILACQRPERQAGWRTGHKAIAYGAAGIILLARVESVRTWSDYWPLPVFEPS
jgi:hypothetical protein